MPAKMASGGNGLVYLIAFVCSFCAIVTEAKPGISTEQLKLNDAVLRWHKYGTESQTSKQHKFQDSEIGISIKNSDGSCVLTVNDKPWLKSASYYVMVGGTKYSTEDGTMKIVASHTSTGVNNLGPYEQVLFDFSLKGLNLNVTFGFTIYREPELFVVFEQMFSKEVPVKGVVADKNTVSTAFPSFHMDDSVGLGYLAYGGIMTGDTYKSIGKWGSGMHAMTGVDSGPLVLFDKKHSLIISPFREFMAANAHYDHTNMTVSWGLLGSAEKIPGHFHYATILYPTEGGVRQVMENWGRVMRRFYRRDESFRYSDMTNNYLGYYTDNGAYYYYLTEANKTYDQTLIDVKTYSDKENIPYRYVQYDSWWYYKGATDWHDKSQGVTEWVAMPEIFPHGSYAVWNATGWPVAAHNRWWSDKNVYAKQNGGKFDFIIESHNRKAMPLEQAFWDYLMQESRKWGLVMYEQDWLNAEFDDMDITVTDLTIARQWLMQMGSAAAKTGLTIQYCMAPSRAALQALEIPVVSQARVSDDYQPGEDNWKIGISSMFADAVGVAPFKDNLWTTAYQAGNPYNKNETHPSLHAVIATLSTGPVGPGDKIGCADAKLIMRSVNADGLILKPSRPAFAIDAQLYQAAFKDGSGPSGEVYSTESVIAGWRFGIVLAADMQTSDSYKITPSAAGFNRQDDKWPDSMVFSYRDSPPKMSVFSDDSPLTLTGCTKTDFCLHYVTPVIKMKNGKSIIILGELDKWVPMSPQRVTYINLDEGTEGSSLHLHLKGAVGETVTFTFADPDTQALTQISCTFPGDGTTRMNVQKKICY